jgi:integral membrane protein
MTAVTPHRLYRALAIAEAITWTLLIGALVLRAVTGFALGVTIAGGIHGFVFLAYGATAVLVAVNQRWHPGVAALAIISAVVPYATIPVELWLARTGRLDGAWRLEQTDDPRDRTWIDRTMRWFLHRPIVLVALIVVAVVALFVVLLMAGPPQLPGK